MWLKISTNERNSSAKVAYISRVLKKLTNIHLHCHLCGSLCNKFVTSCLKPVYSFIFFLCRTTGQAPSLDRFFVALILYLNKIFHLTYLLRSYDTHSYNTTLCHSICYITFSPSNVHVSTYQYKICRSPRLQILRLDLFCTGVTIPL